MISDDEISIPGTPPELVEAVNTASLELLPKKSREKYENAYRRFMDYRMSKNTSSFSENVVMAYFLDLCLKMKSSTLWANYSMLKSSTLAIKHNVDISTYSKLRSLLKRQAQGYRAKKSKILTKEEIEKFIQEAPDKENLMIKADGGINKYDVSGDISVTFAEVLPPPEAILTEAVDHTFFDGREIIRLNNDLAILAGRGVATVPGGCCGSTKRVTIVGGWAWAWWLVTDVQRLSLEVMTLNPQCDSVETAQGVPLTVTGVAQCKIMKADELLHTASEQFLGKSVKEIKLTILQTLEGHLRAILGTLTVEEVYRDRDQFAALVREVAAPDVGRMGIEILSFTIKDVYDNVEYLSSLGKAQTAMVKRDADAGVAEANRDAGIREAECQKQAMDVKYSTDTKIEDNARMYKLQKANFDQEINTAKAESQLAYELQAAKIRQKIRNEEIQIDVVERKKQIEVEAQEVLRKELELNSTVRLPAEAESFRLQLIAEGKRTQTIQSAIADGERIKKIGESEAGAIASVGKAEAERMRQKAAVYKQYGDAAIMSLVLEALPKIAAEVSAPLAKTDEIVLIGGNDNTTAEITRLVGQIPPAVNALTGIDLSKVLGKIPGATTTVK